MQSYKGTILISGSDDETKKYALEMAKTALGENHHSKIEKGIHPDIHIFQPEGKSEMHNVSSMRELIEEMYLPPYESTTKVFIIEQADRMMPVSSNALLKTFEEPSDDALVLLLTSEPQSLLPTIVSRCRCITLNMKKSQEPNTALIELLSQSWDHPTLLKKLEPFEELTDIDAIFHQLLFWYRDRTLLASNGPQTQLFHKEHISSLEKAKSLALPSLEKVLSLINTCRLGAQRHIRLRTCLEHFFLNI